MSTNLNLEVQVTDAQLTTLIQHLNSANAAAQNTQNQLRSMGGDSKQVDAYTASVQKLLDRLDPVGAKARSATADTALLSDAYKTGVINADQYNAALGRLSAAQDKTAHSSAGVRTELIVLAHELLQGNTTRLTGSLMVLGEKTDALRILLTPLGLAFGAVAGAVAVSAVASVKAAESLSTYGEAITRISAQTGSSTDAVQKFNFAAATVGVNGKDAGMALDTLSKKMADAKGGGVEAQRAFAAVGISLSDLKTLNVDQVLALIENKFNSTADNANKLQIAQALLGESGKNLIPLLDQGALSVNNLGNEAATSGKILSEQTVVAANQLAEQMNTLKANTAGFGLEAKSGLLPSLLAIVTAMNDASNGGTKLMTAFQVIGDVMKGTVTVFATVITGLEQIYHVMDMIIAAATAAGKWARGEGGPMITDAVSAGMKKVEADGASYTKFMQDLWAKTAPPSTISAPAAGSPSLPPIQKGGKSGSSNENALNGQLKALEDFIKQRQELEKQSEADLKTTLDQHLVSQTDYFQQLHDDRDNALQDEMDYATSAAEVAKSKKSEAAREAYAQKVKDINAQIWLNDSTYNTNIASLHDKEAASWNKITDSIDKYQASLVLANAKASNKANLAPNAAAQASQLDSVANQASQQHDALFQSYNNDPLARTTQAYMDHYNEIDAREKQSVAIVKQGFADQAAYQADWKNGAISAYNDWQEKATDIAGQTKTAFTNAFDGMNNALLTFVTTGKLSFGDLAKSILTDIANIALHAAESQVLGMIVSAGSAYFGTASSASTIGSGTAVPTGGTAALGGAFEGGIKKFASGGIVTSPTNFGMASGQTGLMGEAGPEAIMPLTRTANGSLGVAVTNGASSGGASAPISIGSVQITVQSNGTDSGAAQGQAIAQSFVSTIQSQIRIAQKPGNLLNPVGSTGYSA